LDLKISADSYYYYDFPFSLETYIDGHWYYVVTLYSVFRMIDYENTIYPGVVGSWEISPSDYAGTLPPGQYRLVREFFEYDPEASDPVGNIAGTEFIDRVFAGIEFTVI